MSDVNYRLVDGKLYVRHEDVTMILKDDLLKMYANPDEDNNFSIPYLKKRIKDMEETNTDITKKIEKQIEDVKQ